MLGVAWVVLQPLLAAGILTFVFGRVARLPADGLPFFVFSFGGMLGWNLFSTTLSRASVSLVTHSSLVAKIFFPRLILPVATSLGAVLDFLVSSVVLAILIATNGIALGVRMLTIPLWVLALLLLALGAGCLLAGLAVTYRDIPQIIPVAVQMLLYLSPVAYSVSAVPERYQLVYHLNPIASLVEGFRWAALGSPAPEAGHAAYAVGVSVLLFLFGTFALARSERRFADVV